MTKHMREAVDAVSLCLRQWLCEPGEVDEGRHLKIRFRSPTGQRGTVVIARSASDRRALRNVITSTARAAREAGGIAP